MNHASTVVAAATLSLTLAACDKPKDRTPPPADAPVAAAPADAALPATPAWAEAYMGKTVTELVPQAGQCVGNTDNVSKKFAAGVEVVGWGWDSSGLAPSTSWRAVRLPPGEYS